MEATGGVSDIGQNYNEGCCVPVRLVNTGLWTEKMKNTMCPSPNTQNIPVSRYVGLSVYTAFSILSPFMTLKTLIPKMPV